MRTGTEEVNNALTQTVGGFAICSCTNVAAESAYIILTSSNTADIVAQILWGRTHYRIIVQNLVWTTAYNAIAIPIAAGLLYGSGFVLSPAEGTIFMSPSIIVVAVNAQLLRNALKEKNR